MSLDQILTIARPQTPIKTGVVPGQKPRGVIGSVVDRFEDSGLKGVPGTLKEIGQNAFPNVKALNAAFASGEPPPEQDPFSKMLGLPPPVARPQGGAPDFLREGNFGKFSESDRALFDPLRDNPQLKAMAAAFTPFGIVPGTGPISEAALSVSGPAIRTGSKVVGGGLDLLGLGLDAAKALPATAGFEEAGLGERGQERIGRFAKQDNPLLQILPDLPKYLENIRDEQKIKEEGGRGKIYMDTMLKKWEEPGYIEALIANGAANEDIASEMEEDLKWMGIAGDWSDFLSDILVLEGAARTPQVLAKITRNSERVKKFGLAKAKRESSLIDRANRKAAARAQRKAQIAEFEKSDRFRLDQKLRKEFEGLSEEQQLEVVLRRGPQDPVKGFKKQLALEEQLSAQEAAARKLQAEGGKVGEAGRALERQAGQRRQSEIGRKLFAQKEAPVTEGVAKPSPKKNVIQKSAAKPKAEKPAEKISQKPSVAAPSTQGPDLTKMSNAQLKQRAANMKAAGKDASAVEAELASRPGNVIKKGAAKSKEKAAPAAKKEAPKKAEAKPSPDAEKKARQAINARKARIAQLEKRIAVLEGAGGNPAAKADNIRKAQPLKAELAKLKARPTGGGVVSEVEAEVAVQAGEKAAAASPEFKAAVEKLKQTGNKIKQGAAKSRKQGGVELSKLKDAQLKERAANLRAAGRDADAAIVEAELASRGKPVGNVVKKGGAKGKKKIEKPVAKEAPAAATGKPVEDMSEAELLAKMVEDLGVGLSTKDAKKLAAADKARKAAFKELIKRLGNPSDAKQAIMDGLKVSSKVADEIIAKGTAPIPGSKPKPPRIFGAKGAEVVTGKGSAVKVVEESQTPLEAVAESIKKLVSSEKKFNQTEAIDDAAQVIRKIGTAVGKPSIFSKGPKVTPKSLVATLKEQGMANDDIVKVLTKLNTPAAGTTRVAGEATKSDQFIKSALKIATGKKQPGTVVKEPFKQNILEKSAGKNIAKPSVRGATTQGELGTFGPDIGKPVPSSEQKFNPFRRLKGQDQEQFKKVNPFQGQKPTKAEIIAAAETPGRPQQPLTKKGVPVTTKDLPKIQPKPRVEEPSIKKVMTGEVSYSDYRAFKRQKLTERKAAMDAANKKKLELEKKFDADTKGAKQRAKEQALYDNARTKESFAQARAREEEKNYFIEQAMKRDIKQELHDLRLQLKRVERASGRGVAAKKKSIQKRIDALVRERENISTIQRNRVGQLGPTASKAEIRFQTLIDAEKSLKDQMKTAVSAVEKEELRLRVAALKVEQDAMIHQLAGSKQFVADADKLTMEQALKDIKEAFKAKTKDVDIGLSIRDTSSQEIKKQNLIKLAQAKAREFKRNEIVREFAVRAQRARQPIEQFIETVKGPDGKGLSTVAKREVVRRVRQNLKHLDRESKIGNFQLGRMVERGDLEPEIAEVFSKVYAENPHLFDSTLRRAVGGQAVRQETYNVAARKVGKQLFDLTDAQMASVYSMPMSDAIMMTNQFIEGRVPAQLALDTVRSLLINYDRGGAQLGRALNARKGLFKYDQLIADVKRMGAKGTTTKEAEEAALQMVEMFGKYRKNPTKLQQVYDIYQEYSVNNILGAGITFNRNLVGATTEVFINQPKERIMRGLLTQTIGRLPGVGIKDPVYLREVLPELKALYYNLPAGIETGTRFALRGTTRGVLNSMAEELLFLERFAQKQPRWVQRQVQKRIAWTMRRRSDLLEMKAGVRTGEVFTGKEGSKIIDMGTAMRDANNPLVRALGVGTQVGGTYINVPVRGLLAADAILQESSYQGHKAATLWRRASRVLKNNKGSRIKKEVITEFKFGKVRKKTIQNVVGRDGKVLLKNIGGGKLTEFEKAQALDDALAYMYRAPFKSELGQKIERALRSRGLNNVFLFAKTRTNILKMTLARNPITGSIDATRKSLAATLERNKLFTGKKVILDSKSIGKVMNGMATLAWMKWQADMAGGRYVGPSKNAAERQRRLMRGLPELYYEHVKGQPEKGVSMLSNQAPLTGEAAQLASWTRFLEDLEDGKTPLAATMRSFKTFVNSMRQDSMYSDVEGITRFIQGTVGKGADPNIPFGERLSQSIARTVSSRLNPNRGRETRQSGKFLGIPIPGLVKDNTIIQPDSGNPLVTLGQTLLHDRFSQLPTPQISRKLNVFTGEPIVRAPRYSPTLVNVLSTIHPNFLTKRNIPDDHLSPEELIIGELLEDYDVTVPLPPKSLSLGGEQLGLTVKEQNKFIELMTTRERSSMHNTVIVELMRVERRIRRREGRPGFDFQRNRKEIEGKLRDMKTEVNKQILPDVTVRLYKTAAGRERLWSTLNRDRIPWKDDEEHRRKLKRIISRANFWVGSDIRRLQIP
jgi:hypothetical protein